MHAAESWPQNHPARQLNFAYIYIEREQVRYSTCLLNEERIERLSKLITSFLKVVIKLLQLAAYSILLTDR